MDLISLTELDFKENIEKGTWIVQFWVSWCGPCIDTRELEEFQLVSPGITVGRVNVEENINLGIEYSINVYPTYVLFKKGNPIKWLVGFQTADYLKKMVKS